MITNHPYKAEILRAYSTDIESESQGYKKILDIECDVQTNVKESTPYVYTHVIYWWNDAKVTFNGVEMKWSQYLSFEGRTILTSGQYFRVSFYDKTITGEIKSYEPSQLGVMLKVDINSI